MYLTGKRKEIIPSDKNKAAEWFRKAAGKGNADNLAWRMASANAQFSLGYMHEEGWGIRQTKVHAYAWYNLAAARGHAQARTRRQHLAEGMTKNQMARAQRFSEDLEHWIAGGGEPPPPAFVSDAELKRLGGGSGFLVDLEGRIVTNYHVVEDCDSVAVQRKVAADREEAPHEAKIEGVDITNDLALLRASPEVGERAVFGRATRADLGETVVVAGYPLHGIVESELNVTTGTLNVTTGSVSALAGADDDMNFLQVDATVQSGNSGGPLLDGAGNVIGVVTKMLNIRWFEEKTGRLEEGRGFAIKGPLVRSFLDIQGVTYRRASSSARLSTERLAERAGTFTVAIHCYKVVP